MSTYNVAARYVALFLQASSYAGYIVLYSWISSSFPHPPAKRAVAIAMINSLCQLGNVAGEYVWDLSANGYRSSYGVVLAMFCTTIVCCWVFRQMLANLNKKLEAGETAWTTANDIVKETARAEHLDTIDEALDMKKGFRYLL
jgi:MFS family permease